MTRRLLLGVLSALFASVGAKGFAAPVGLPKHGSYLVLFKEGKPANAWRVR